jgi:hypothetical protein
MLKATASKLLAFRPTSPMRLSAWTLFVKQNSVKGQRLTETMKTIKAKWDVLTPAQKEALAAEGAKIKSKPRKLKKLKKGDGKVMRTSRRALSPYNLFVKAQMPTLQGPVSERMKIVAQRWKASQQGGSATPSSA